MFPQVSIGLMEPQRRVLLSERISYMRDEESDSIATQDEKLLTAVHENSDVKVVGTAVDENVSGDVDMKNRPQLGQWLTEEKLEEWDELWVTTQDRLSRSDVHFMAFVFLMLNLGKRIVVLDDPHFTDQMTTVEGRLILHAKALGPAKELERIKIRVQESHDARRWTSRWPGGIPKFGYETYQVYENGKVATYTRLNADMVSVLFELAKFMNLGQTFSFVASWLNMGEIFTARDRARLRRGKPARGRRKKHSKELCGTQERWTETSVRLLLTDEALLGYKKHRGKIMYDQEGNPVRLADAVFTKDEWETLQASCQRRRVTTVRRVNGASPMYAVAHCSGCYSKAVHKVTNKDVLVKATSDHPEYMTTVQYRYYQCGAYPKELRCKGISCRADVVEEMAEVLFLQKYGNYPVTKRIWVPGSDHSTELDDVRRRIGRLLRQDEEGDWEHDRKGYRERMDTYKARQASLEAIPVRRSGWVEEDQGMTFMDRWPQLDLEGKRLQLIESGFRIMIGKSTCWPDKAPIPITIAG